MGNKKIVVELTKDNRVMSKDIVDGQDFIWLEPVGTQSRLHVATAARCDDCNALGAVNSLPVQNDQMMVGLKWTSKVPVDVGAYDADGSGDCLCSICDAKRTLDSVEKQQAAEAVKE